jgi:N-acyl-L-homoserine lactone synthetase
MSYQILLVSHPKTLKRLFEFRYQSYCLRDNLLSPLDYPEKIEHDAYDLASTHLVAFDHSDKIVGCVRLIRAAETILPTEKEFELTQHLAHLSRSELYEISRLIVAPDYQRSLLLFDLLRAVFIYSRQHEINHWCGCVEAPLLSCLHRFFGNFPSLSQPKFCFNAQNTPFLISRDLLYEQTIESFSRSIKIRCEEQPAHIILNREKTYQLEQAILK